MAGQPHHVNWKTVGVIAGFAGAIFAGGMAYQRLGHVERDVDDLKEDTQYLRSRVDEIHRSLPTAYPHTPPDTLCDECKIAGSPYGR
jgi:hypothetical protein